MKQFNKKKLLEKIIYCIMKYDSYIIFDTVTIIFNVFTIASHELFNALATEKRQSFSNNI